MEPQDDLANTADKETPLVIRSLWLLLVLWVTPTTSGQTSFSTGLPEMASPQKLPLHVYNLAHISAGTLDRAIELAQKILAKAGVVTVWDRGPMDAAEAHFTDMTGATPSQRLKADDRGYLVVEIIRGEPESAFPGALGFALPFAHAGPHAIIFYDRIERILLSVPGSVTRVLGHALAHEVGHALLETGGHSQYGLMKARWSKADFLRTAVSFLEFSPEQARTLQDNAHRRMALATGLLHAPETEKLPLRIRQEQLRRVAQAPTSSWRLRGWSRVPARRLARECVEASRQEFVRFPMVLH